MDGSGAEITEPILNRSEIAQAFDVSANTIGKWVKRGMPVETVGSNGQPYEFLHSECLEWFKDSKAAAQRDQADRAAFVARQQAEFLGLKVSDQQSHLTPTQVRDISVAHLTRLQLDAKRKKFVPVEEMADLLDRIFTEIRSALDGQPDWLDRELSLTSVQVVKVVAYNDSILKGMSESIKKAALYEIDSDVEKAALI